MKEYYEHLTKRRRKKRDKNTATDCGIDIFFFDISVPLTVASMEVW
jgi:hypothetical protein